MLEYITFSTKTEIKIVRILKRLRNTLLLLILLLLLITFKGRRKNHYREVSEKIPSDTFKYLFYEKSKNSSSKNIYQLRKAVNYYNHEGLYEGKNMINGESLGPIAEDTVVFVVTVHGLTIYLKFLIVSLAQVQGIEQVLVVFSHKVFDEDANNLIKSIDFCRVLQIYYPYSLQMYPYQFPGYSPQDCPHDMDMKTAEAINCAGSRFPDFKGHFRNPKQVEQKHHWWWTANAVFENILGPIENYTGVVVFIQEDSYILKDFLYMTLFMKHVCNNLDNCEFLTFECKSASFTCIKNDNGLEIMKWDLSYEPSVLAFDVKVWNSIVFDYDIFCTVDDSSWARSLLYLSMKREVGPQYKIMSSMFPRLYKTSSCELERFLKNCDVIESVYQILELQSKLNESLFPAHLEVFTNIENEDDLFAPEYSDHGGWNDPRDKDMCKNLTLSKIKKIVREMRQEFIKFIEM